jgi:magnesium chelatase subunit D
VREHYLGIIRQHLAQGSAWRRLPLNIEDDRLLGGLDLASTLALGRPVLSRGLLTEADGGVIAVSMAERMPVALAARLAAVMDQGVVQLARDGLTNEMPARIGIILLDEGVDDERVPAELVDRCAFHVLLDDIPLAQIQSLTTMLDGALSGADETAAVAVTDRFADRSMPVLSGELMHAMCATSVSLGIGSVRADLLACRCAIEAADWAGRSHVEADDVTLAARLVLAPRATRWPDMSDAEAPEPETPPPPEQADDHASESPSNDVQSPADALDDVVLEAAKSAIPSGLLAMLLSDPLSRNRVSSSGRSGAWKKSGQRGRPAGVRSGIPGGRVRLSLIDTLRAAAPWQRLRGAHAASRIAVRVDDLRVRRFKERSETTTIFLVDASGSSAVHRLAEAKGAVELLLADCYVRRDQVAVIAFRGRQAEVILPPTRSLVRAKKSLAGLPGGGGTPLALAMDAAVALGTTVAQRGGTPVVVVLTDGRANVARDGQGGRERAQADASDAARQFACMGFAAMVIDTSPQPSPAARSLAEHMRARYMPLPHAGAEQVSAAVRVMAR